MMNRVKVLTEITLHSLEHTLACIPIARQRPREIAPAADRTENSILLLLYPLLLSRPF
jgi:hypothetical protein